MTLKELSREIVQQVTDRLGSFGTSDEIIRAETDVERLLEKHSELCRPDKEELENLRDRVAKIKRYIEYV